MAAHRPPPILTPLAAVILLGAACAVGGGAGDEPVDRSAGTAASAGSAPTVMAAEPVPTVPDPAPTTAPTTGPTTGSTSDPSPPPAGRFACRAVDVEATGRIGRADLVETSGLGAATSDPEVLWAHNDSGRAAGVFAIGLDGRDLGFFELVRDGVAVPALDVEDIAVVDGSIYLADIGDNGRSRASVHVYVVAEPTPGADGTIEVARDIEIRYPDGPTDAEALLVDPRTGDLVILSKDLDDPTGPTGVYVVEAAAANGEPVTARPAGTIDVAALTASSSRFSLGALAFPGAVTAADVTAAGDLIGLRTYGSVWLFDRPDGRSLADSLRGAPCEGGAAAESQGEALAFLAPAGPAPAGPRTVRYVTVGEGDGEAVNLITVEVAR